MSSAKPLRVLVANHTLDMWGGSETYAYAVVEELVRQGHSVETFATRPGCVSERLRAQFGVNAMHVSAPGIRIDGAYDLQLISHNPCVRALRDVQGYKIQTCHGTLPKVEQPVRGVDRHVAVSEEVQQHLKRLGFESTVIHNGVNCERFQPRRPIRERPERVLALMHTEEAALFVDEACRIAGLELRVRNKFEGGVFRIEDDMNEADVVISLGRGVYEAMACARNVYVFDKRRYQEALADGMVTADNVDELLKFNCSGRRLRRAVTPKEVAAEIMLGYSSAMGQRLRAYAVQHLNIRMQVDKYLALYREAA